ncbi:phosphoribosyltransferase [Actinomycetaceae bacterium TAE3-ERU4]|nr:phosphoribosyltransferase [Actinomycetaceae bacterium TAE3-ERU4]
MAFDDGATSNDGTPRENLTWDGFGEATRDLARQVRDSGWMPDLIVAVARGGLLPAGAVSYALGVKAMGTMNVEFYTDVAETLPEPVLLPPLMDVSAMDGKRVLVVDDVADSGKTLKMVMELIAKRGLSLDGHTSATVDARSLVIYEKSRSVIKPDFVWKNTDLWINFPWSVLPPVTAEGQE